MLFTIVLIEMSKNFQKKLMSRYKDDQFWSKITILLQKKKTSPSLTKLSFCFENNLIFCHNKYISLNHAFESCCLYISQLLFREILRANYDENWHLEFLRYYKWIVFPYYIWNLSAYLKVYLKYCPSYNLNQTWWYPTYGNLQPILSLPIPFHSVIIDFILTFSLSYTRNDNLITATYKFVKCILLILGQSK